jgi:hypothetical protein
MRDNTQARGATFRRWIAPAAGRGSGGGDVWAGLACAHLSGRFQDLPVAEVGAVPFEVPGQVVGGAWVIREPAVPGGARSTRSGAPWAAR